MIDIKLIRDNPDLIRSNLTKRFQKEKIQVLEDAIALDGKWRRGLDELNRLRHQKNLLDQEIRKKKISGQSAKDEMAQSREISSRIRQLEKEVSAAKQGLDQRMLQLPNIVDGSAPIGQTEEENVVVRRWGGIPQFPFRPRDHIELGLELDLFDLEKAASVAGARWYYLKNELVLLQMALLRFAMDKLISHGFTPIYPPALIREKIMEGAGYLPEGREDIYKIEGEDLYLVGTSEQALAGLHEGEILQADDLPRRYAGISPCFRTEAGSHGRDTKGIFRVHQFEKVEMFVFSLPDESQQEQELMLSIAEEIYRELKIPYRIVDVCTGELGWVASRKFDLEVWLPGQKKYREAVSCSNCTDYQARRLRVRYREAPGKSTQFVHTLNSTALASTRTMIAIMENHQTAEGKIVIPDVLRSYLPGLQLIETHRDG